MAPRRWRLGRRGARGIVRAWLPLPVSGAAALPAMAAATCQGVAGAIGPSCYIFVETDRLRGSAMDQRNPLTTVEARDHFAEVLDRAALGKERVVLTRHGRPLAAIVPIEDVEALEALEDARDSADIRARLAEWEGEGRPGVSLEEVARRHGIVLGDAEE